jgi:UDP-N-acetylglucosamine enolpyruvyl transferase
VNLAVNGKESGVPAVNITIFVSLYIMFQETPIIRNARQVERGYERAAEKLYHLSVKIKRATK